MLLFVGTIMYSYFLDIVHLKTELLVLNEICWRFCFFQNVPHYVLYSVCLLTSLLAHLYSVGHGLLTPAVQYALSICVMVGCPSICLSIPPIDCGSRVLLVCCLLAINLSIKLPVP